MGKIKFLENRGYQLLLSGLLVMILVSITYWEAPENEFVDWDDYAYVVDNNLVRNQGDAFFKDLFSAPVSLNYHPLTILSLRANSNNCKTCPNGISPAPFIRGNIFLHILNSILVLIFVYLLFNNNILIAFLVAAVFGVHPMHVESVAWIAERKDVLYTFFFLGGLIAYFGFIKNWKRKYLWLLSAFILFVFACLSKAMAVVFPVVLILINFWTYQTDEEKPVQKAFKNAFSQKNLLLLAPFFVVSVFFGLMAFRIQNGQNFLGLLNPDSIAEGVVNTIRPFSVLQRLQVASYGFVVYILKFFVPVNLSAYYPYPSIQAFSSGSFAILLWAAFAAVVLIAFLLIRTAKKTKLYIFSMGFYFVAIMLVMQFISVGLAIMAERYSYLSYIGLSIIPAALVAQAPKKRRNILLLISGCFIIALIFLSRQQIGVWRNTETLWTNVIKKYPHQELPRRIRGKYYSKQSSLAQNDSVKKILENKAFIDFSEAIKAGTTSADVFEGTGMIYESEGDLKNALTFLNKAISLNPRKGQIYYNRAMVYDMLNMKEESIKDYTVALALNPDLAIKILSNRAVLLIEAGRFRQAISDLDRLIVNDGKNFMYYYNRAYSKLQIQDIDGAIEDYNIVLLLNPQDTATRKQLQVLIGSRKKH